MKKIETVIHIHRPPQYVWEVLMDFKNYPNWNPFITGISGKAKKGEQLSVTITLPGKKGMSFSPVILKIKPQEEFRWKGKFIVKGFFDGEHYFLLQQLPNGSTSLRHGEIFTGLLPSILSPLLKNTQTGFELMNVALKEHCENEDQISKLIK